MTGDDLIHLAGHLIANTALGDPEARYRSAVSRAYYGAFHLASAFLADCGARILSNHTGHVQAARILQANGHPDVVEASRLLDDLRSARNEADYNLQKKRLASRASAQADVEMAADLQICLARCRKEPAFSQIKATIGMNRP
jgi:uncharacterized protein (UPF0332 family)